jgi:opacity protein-like surface antigen
MIFPAFASCAVSQELPARQSFGVNGSFAPDSSHILIGISEERRTWTTGLEYGRTLWGNQSIRLDYEGSITPFFQERDPTLIGFSITPGGPAFLPVTPGRVVAVNRELGPGSNLYNVYSTTKTYAFAISPIGARISGFNSHKLQSTFSTDMGMVFSTRDLPIDDSSSFNFLFSFGPGFEYFYTPNNAVRLEYLYRHLSNANLGATNPGVDQGTFRLTLSHRRR